MDDCVIINTDNLLRSNSDVVIEWLILYLQEVQICTPCRAVCSTGLDTSTRRHST